MIQLCPRGKVKKIYNSGKQYGIGRSVGIGFDNNPYQVRLRDFHFRRKEVWVYEYDLTCWWQHELLEGLCQR